MSLTQELLQILVCPACKRTVTWLEGDSVLVCAPCRLRYPVRDGIPVMLVDEAEKVSEG